MLQEIKFIFNFVIDVILTNLLIGIVEREYSKFKFDYPNQLCSRNKYKFQCNSDSYVKSNGSGTPFRF